jgi:hypothetical protein
MRTRIEVASVALVLSSCTVPGEIRVTDARPASGDAVNDIVVPTDVADGSDVASDLGASAMTESAGYVFLGRAGTGGPAMITLEAPITDRPNAAVSAFFGGEVSGLADYNGDGNTDFALGAPRAGVALQSNAGFVYIYSFDSTMGTVTMRRRVDLLTYVSPTNSPTYLGQGK